MATQEYLGDSFTSARATPELVGREHEVAEVVEMVSNADSSTLIHIVGEGGIGMTRILPHLLKKLSEDTENLWVASALVDLYHAEVNTIEGLVGELSRVLDPTGEHFPVYQENREKLQSTRALRPHAVAEIASLHDLTIASFSTDLAALSSTKRVVFGLDTAEKLDIQHNPIAEYIDVQEAQVGTVDWLCTLLSETPNVSVLLAGRPGRGGLDQLLKSRVPGYHYLDLKGLREEEALAYFEAVTQRLESAEGYENRWVARRVLAIPLDIRKSIFYSLRDDGEIPTVRPILLALAIDFMVVSEGQDMLEFFSQSSAVAMQMDAAQCTQARERLGIEFIKLLSQRLAPADRLVKILGWLRKGATRTLLQDISKLESSDFDDAWQKIQGLSFVKERPKDNRIFLHDEMYQILQSHALNQGTDSEGERIFASLREYYEGRIRLLEKQIDALFRPLASNYKDIIGDASTINRLRNEVRSCYIEDVFYRLRGNGSQGFQTYFRYSEEAVFSHDHELGTLLRSEMRAYVGEFGMIGATTNPEGFTYADVVADEAVRWVKWVWNTGKYTQALDLARRLQAELFEPIIQPGGILAQAELDSWRGFFEGNLGNYPEAEVFLTRSIESLLPFKNTHRWVGVLASAYANLGYTYRVQGRIHHAIAAYKNALPFLRALRVNSGLAYTLNNLGFALAETGNFDNARQYVREGLRLREQLGPRQPVGLSLNTLAEINIRAFASEVAISEAERALAIFVELNDRRDQGLALRALAEAKRRSSSSPTNVQLGRTITLLEESEDAAKESIEIFKFEVSEPVRLVLALIELGCVYREWMRRRLSLESTHLFPRELDYRRKMSVDDLCQLSEDNFEQASAIAGEHDLISNQLDALIGLAWLLHFRNDNRLNHERLNILSSRFNEVRQDIDQAFFLHFGPSDDTYREQLRNSPRDEMLIRRGDWETFQAVLYLHESRTLGDEDFLTKAAMHSVLAFACYQTYSEFIFAKLRASRNRIFAAISILSRAELNLFYECVNRVEEDFGFPNSAFTKFLSEQFGTKDEQILLEF